MTRNFVNQVDRLLKISKSILLVEHNPIKRNELVDFLNEQRHQVAVAKDGMTASEKINSETFDLFIIDKSLPYNDAMTLYKSIKKKKMNTPVIFIADKNEVSEVVSIDYQTFKEDFEQTLKSIIEQSLQVKEQNTQEETEVYRIGSFTLNPKLRLLQYKDQKPVKLTPKENKLLKVLISFNNKLVDKKTLQKKVWYNDENVSFGSMNVYISRLRKLLSKDKSIKITNVYKTGFKISD